MLDENIIRQIKTYAELNNIPIMMDSGLNYLLKYISKNKIKRSIRNRYSYWLFCNYDV